MILETMLQRLYSDLVHGPCLNCRPHSSRQRVDLQLFTRLKNAEPGRILHALLGGAKRIEIPSQPFSIPQVLDIAAGVPISAKLPKDDTQKFLVKLKDISEDAAEYEQDTGESALNIGFPLLCLPPTEKTGGASGLTSRILAPIAFIPVSLSIQRNQNPSITLQARGGGTDWVIPNAALLAWIEQQTGCDTGNLFSDEEGADPYREINEIVRFVCGALKLDVPPEFTPSSPLAPAPRAEEMPPKPALIQAAVLGLFPVANQGLLRDTRAMMAGESLDGPVQSFLGTEVLRSSPAGTVPAELATLAAAPRVPAEERLIASADPCQNQAVKLARHGPALVIHGPPGTGKSQTITNIIGDHLSRGERVLVVCDKRTALDVVKFRLDHAGLGRFCAVVHDPQRDQRVLYKTIRDQLEALAEEPEEPSAEAKLKRVNTRLESLYGELGDCHSSLQKKDGAAGLSFHEMVGHWFALDTPPEPDFKGLDLTAIELAELEHARAPLGEVFQKALKVRYPSNPWTHAVGLPLGQFLAQPLASLQVRLEGLRSAALAADEFAASTIVPFAENVPLPEQGAARARLAAQLRQLIQTVSPATLARWSGADTAALQRACGQIDQVKAALAIFNEKPFDPELALLVKGRVPALAQLNAQIGSLTEYRPYASQWYGFLIFGKRAAAADVLKLFGLKVDPGSVDRVLEFLEGLKARLILTETHRALSPDPCPESPVPDATIAQSFRDHGLILDLFQGLDQSPLVRPFVPHVRQLMREHQTGEEFIKKLAEGEERAKRLDVLESGLQNGGFFNAEWLALTVRELRAGAVFGARAQAFMESLPTLEDSIRLREALLNLPKSAGTAVEFLLQRSLPPEAAWTVLLKGAYHNELSRRIQAEPALQKIDPERMDAVFGEIFELEKAKSALVTGQIRSLWQSRRKQRLLASTGTQLNSLGTRLKQRLFLRGERALKLRPMVLMGREIPDGDPLFDVCPVWMASPTTVAQIFPREAIFDVVIFDEASQARLEEALPVLTRGKRIVIAGDPKQLPPTRFFESGVAESDAAAPENDQELFEQQQSEVEDLLMAALNIQMRQSYLDVHYRSQHSGLIEFSNQQFYHGRLQALPRHPGRAAGGSPIQFHRVDGLYANRQNQREAELARDIIEKLLAQPNPPSIGIACFNLHQRDLILDALDARAEENPEFAERLQAARERQGAGSFEGLFVKNLENVQGDERDHIIISTTFGLDAEGKFRRNFGPLGRLAGGRRLNVLVTRARHAVHLLTSIPRAEYINLPPLGQDQLPNGRYYLYAYLKYAEELTQAVERPALATRGSARANDAGASPLPPALADNLRETEQIGSAVEWGNAGFCVDLALHPPESPGDVRLGVLCDTSRYAKFSDPVEWDLFKTRILGEQGWTLQRVWSPNIFRNPEATTGGIAKTMRAAPSQAPARSPGPPAPAPSGR